MGAHAVRGDALASVPERGEARRVPEGDDGLGGDTGRDGRAVAG